MELLQLQYFQTVARLEHMTRAAEALRIAQPALSKTIARLETDLGVPLFDRQNRHIRLNAFGKAFLKKVDAALGALEEGKRELADLAGTEKGSIHLATSTLGRLSKPVGAFRVQFPDVSFRILQLPPSSTDEMVRLLVTGEIDLCFTSASFGLPGILEMPVLNAEVFLAVPPGHRFEGRSSINLKEAAHEPFVEYREGHPFRWTNEDFCRKAGIRPPVVCEVDEPSAITDLVMAGLGVAFVPACKNDDKPPFAQVRIEEPDCRRTFSVAWHANRYLSKAARTFQDFLVRYFEEIESIGMDKR